MCGIAGILSTENATVDLTDLQKLAKALAHRGPDGEGIWQSADKRAGFVHRRLAIIDTSERGHQPMHSDNGAYSIVFNGEIYNFIELRSQLERLGSVFRTESDTEVILEAWRHWGKDMLARFNGMWAIAIRDNRSGELFLARDRFGIKPMLYSQGANHFVFASEMRTFDALPWLRSEFDQEVARRMLFDPFSIEAGERTLVKSIRRLPAGHMATLRDGTLRIERWWRTVDHLESPPSNPADQASRFRELFLDSVRIRMRSDVSIGTCLSGGFDSSAVVGAMAKVAADQHPHMREAQSWRHAFIASFPGQPNDETPEALEAARYANVNPHVFALQDGDALTNIEQVLEDLDEIYISLPTAPWQIYRELRDARTLVSLDGHGADELMGGYRQRGETLGFVVRNVLASTSTRYRTSNAWMESAKATWLSARGMNFLRNHRVVAPSGIGTPFDEDVLPAEWGALNRRLYRMFHATVLPTILRNFDRLSMAHGVEVRMPFMDWRLVTYTMSLPDAAKSSQGWSKFVARQAMTGVMHEGIRTARRKVGFDSPMPAWLNGPLQSWVEALLHQKNAMFDELVDTPALCKKVTALTSSKSWDWQSVGRLWPYIHLKWHLERRGA